jgi:hypothetical protein
MNQRAFYIAIVAVVFGAILWFSVSMREQYQITVDLPLTIDGIPDGWAVRTPVPQTLQLKLSGDGWRLAALQLGPELGLTLPVSMFSANRRLLLVNEVADRFSFRPGIHVVSVVPETLSVELDRAVRRMVPVDVDCAFTYGDGYGPVGPVSVSPESVSVSGAETLLRTLASWKTDHRVFDNLRAPLDADVPLASRGLYLLTLTPSVVKIRVPVESFAEKTFAGLPVEVQLLPANREVLLVPPRIEVVARAGIRQLSNLSDTSFHVSASYPEILADTSGTIEPHVVAPPGVHIVRKRPDRLTYIIRKPL